MSQSVQHKVQGITLSTKHRKFLLSRSFVHQIPECNKKLVVGYILWVFKQIVNNHNLPSIIIQWCLVFFNSTVDHWNPLQVHSSMVINGSKVKRTTSWGYRAAFLTNVVSMGIHVWKFRWSEIGYFDCIGIESIKSVVVLKHGLEFKPKTRKRLNYFHTFTSKDTVGNDIIDMRINFASCALTIMKNDLIVCQKQIRPGKYKAAVSLSVSRVEVELLAYQHFYVKA